MMAKKVSGGKVIDFEIVQELKFLKDTLEQMCYVVTNYHEFGYKSTDDYILDTLEMIPIIQDRINVITGTIKK